MDGQQNKQTTNTNLMTTINYADSYLLPMAGKGKGVKQKGKFLPSPAFLKDLKI